MAMQFCIDCDKQIDLDFNIEHFEEHRSLDDVMEAASEIQPI